MQGAKRREKGIRQKKAENRLPAVIRPGCSGIEFKGVTGSTLVSLRKGAARMAEFFIGVIVGGLFGFFLSAVLRAGGGD